MYENGFYCVQEVCFLNGERMPVGAEGQIEAARQEAEKRGSELECYVSVGHYRDPHTRVLGTVFDDTDEDRAALVALVESDIAEGFVPLGLARDIIRKS